ncbi:hypothetical protein ABB37_07553 [Leptomonas pyrrhocoris]|uniref:FCP1 homology domain-containing protein n=1 Tax=Leptomonas pyrrhocoris TaxID=157538 RepID=A0A0M9FV51_LEPPY|nr:hypothetical protein ABB37_07553 [Leptomonas pyrrhocoris]KPA76720.1 hypothetical protein ABB37_07553 [Leptomonas pyrrhocoris]|eukprot:XP_015655159.1 hypothetical protein ABB37_07553 [Leptomonas pyrrhocoris]
MRTSSTFRRESTTSDGPTLLNSNQPKTRAALASKKINTPPGLSWREGVPRHVGTPSTSSSTTTSPLLAGSITTTTAAAAAAATMRLTRTATPTRRAGTYTRTATAGTSTRAVGSSNVTPSTTPISTNLSTQCISTPRAASPAYSSSTATLTPGVQKPRTTTSAVARGRTQGPRFAQSTVSSRAHLPSSDSNESEDGVAPRAGIATHTTAAVESGRLQRLPSARGGSKPVSCCDTESQKTLPRDGSIRRGAASPIEPGAAQMKSSSRPTGALTGRKKTGASDDRSGNTSVGENTDAPRGREREDASAAAAGAAPPVASVHRVADPAPTIGTVRRKAQPVADASQSELRDPSQSPKSSQQPCSTASTSASMSGHTPAEALNTSVPDITSSTLLSLSTPVGAHEAQRGRSASRSSHGSPRSSEMASGRRRASSTAASSALSTPVHSPKAESAAARAKVEMHSLPPPTRPTVVPQEDSPIVHEIPATAATSRHTIGAPAVRTSPSAPAASVPATRRSGTGDTGRRSTSPCAPPPLASTRKTAEEKKIGGRAVTPLSFDDLGRTDRAGLSAAPPAATTAAEDKLDTRSTSRLSLSRLMTIATFGVLDTTSAETVNATTTTTAAGATPGAGIDEGVLSDHLAKVLEMDADVEVKEQSTTAHSAPTLVAPSTSRNPSNRRAHSVSERSHTPAAENVAALLADLLELRQREEAAAQCVEAAQKAEEDEEAEAEMLRSHRRAAAAVRSSKAADLAGSRAVATDDEDEQCNPFLVSDKVDVGDVEEGEEEGDDDDGGAQARLSRATDTTGHAPITPRLRHRIEREQQRELELLRTITKERHPENVELLDSPNTLRRELSFIDPDMDPAEAEEVLRSCSSEAEMEEQEEAVEGRDRQEESQSVGEVADEPTPVLHSEDAVAAELPKASSAAVEKTKAATSKPPLRDDVSTTPSAPRRSGVVPDVASASAETSEKPRETSRWQRAGSSARSDVASANEPDRKNAPSSLSQSSVPPAASQTPPRSPSSRGCRTSTAESNNSSSAVNHRSGAKFARCPSKTAVNSEATPTATAAAADGTERRRRMLPESALSGGVGANNCVGTPTEHPRRTVPRHGGTLTHSVETTSPQSDKAATTELLLPALLSPEEAANTITVVFDLDETLCNNRGLGGTVLRPGAQLLLHTLRSLAPSPRYKFIDTRARGQHATNRLYNQAMLKLGMTPLYRPRVAQRQESGDYNIDNVGSSTGEARPATGKETSPLRLELVLWTASEESLARRAVRRLDPQNAIFDEAIYRDVRWYRDSYYTKELRRLGRHMHRIVIIENSVESVIHNRKNAILVTSFVSNRLDRQLFLVREVLRDWIRGMRLYLASVLECHAAKQRVDATPTEEHVATAINDVVRLDSDHHGHLSDASLEEGGESPVPPHSTTSPSRAESSTGATEAHNGAARYGSRAESRSSHRPSATPEREPSAQSSASAPSPKGATSSLMLSTSSLSASSNSTGSASRMTGAVVQLAANVVHFLSLHRLIMDGTNYINFQLTGEVMMRLQSTQPAVIAAALAPPPAEMPATRPMRSTPCGPAPRSPRAARAPLAGSSPPAPSASAAAADSPQKSGPTASAAAQGVSATAGNDWASTGGGRGPASTNGGTQSSAVRARPVSRSDAPHEVKREFNPASPSKITANATAAPNAADAISALRAAREGRPVSAAANAQGSKNNAGAGAPVDANGAGGPDRYAVRPQRTPSVTAKRQAA